MPGRREPGSQCPFGNTALKNSTSKAQSSDARPFSSLPQAIDSALQPWGLPATVLQGWRGAGFLSWDRAQSGWGRPVLHLLEPEDIRQWMRSMLRLCPISLKQEHEHNLPLPLSFSFLISVDIKKIQMIQVSKKKKIKVLHEFTVCECFGAFFFSYGKMYV